MQSSLEPVQTLRCHDPLEASRHGRGRPRQNKALSKRKSSDFLLEAAPHRQRLKSRSKTNGWRPDFCPLPENVMQFTILNHSTQKAFEFSLDTQWAYRGTKRCRLGTDVEGPNTATISRKKRRLRTQLITSRLSQPFSQPATHILNRNGRQVGDRRFVKMAITLDSSRRAAHLQETAYLRYSIMNCMRKRMGIARSQDSGKTGQGGTVRQSMDTYAKAPWQSREMESAPEAKARSLETGHKAGLGSQVASKEFSDIQSAETLVKAPACRLSKPIALPLPSADADATNDRSSARIDSTKSPEPRPPLSWMYDDCEEDSFAFLHLDEEHLDDDDSDVYCDFDALFGAKATSPDPQSPSEEHTYEEYMDELDGISWRVG
ncbi:uncharacterized protein TrAFT101_011810 [Trichoderma asperellum]|uniref:Uncharacterized protein n=1 Tax=Trichoderma asperellum (strain ATCC 204424 / CBS 433.97 / NBRC 101777) TaxID=1042311 RepID=A0A2T3YZV7_TRIA4|nr:hypothetical protein M441DRAFT_246543 [Trichoderma asperellum CBS 433.97]PTB38085.1 hypothetical protein M441DRAFT_246543 [Trichoderma asperellum CBS 433.97]UKZ97041.1 hypothetical protein TrAFT101_011810 [Trichoderma asperellum]